MRIFPILLALAVSSPAAALDLGPKAQALLDRGRPYAEVTPDSDGTSGVIRAAIDIAAPIGAVWSVMTDCDLAPKMVANLKSCRILERDPQGRWDIREQVSRMTFLPSVRSVFREDFEPPNKMTFHRIDGDLDVLEGEWRLTQHGERVRVTYEARVAAPFAVPGWIARLALRHDVPMALLAMRREAIARATKAP
ncbi:SRPBCC family protein [Phenylobacterium sp.]|uniref:SRPBCC family protein n=1 Tax=Phenylobacterium sp. TaxID=1871053 RepID=UPI002F404B3E